MARKPFIWNIEAEPEITAWIAAQPNFSAAIRDLIRATQQLPTGASLDENQLRRVLREELRRVQVNPPLETTTAAHVDADKAAALVMW